MFDDPEKWRPPRFHARPQVSLATDHWPLLCDIRHNSIVTSSLVLPRPVRRGWL